MAGITTMRDMSHKRWCIALIFTFLWGGGAAVEAKIKCWKNNDGVRECGNVVPPEYAQQGHEEKSASGLTLGTTARAKSVEELEAERIVRQEQEAALMLEREQAAKDRVLLDTFSSEDDMLLARDGQIAHLESQIKLTESHIDKLKSSLDDLIQNAADHERRGKQPPDKLVRDIDSLRDQVRDNRVFIETKHRESTEILENFEINIIRFRELMRRTNQGTSD